MKQKLLLLIGALFFIATTLISCKKEYTCKCSKTYTSGSSTSTNDYSFYTYKETRNRAETRCNENTKSGTGLFGNFSINCQIQ